MAPASDKTGSGPGLNSLDRPAASPVTVSNCGTGSATAKNCGEAEPSTEVPGPALTLWLELEVKCNLSCEFCYNPWRGDMSIAPRNRTTEEIVQSLDEVPPGTLGVVALSGGEPLLRPDLAEIVSHVARLGARSVLTTNGVLLSSMRLTELTSAGLTAVQIAIHGATPDTHDSLAGGQSWFAAVAAVRRCVDAGVPVTPVFVATAQNVSEFPAFVELLGELGVSRTIFNRVVPGGLASKNWAHLSVSDSRILDALEAADPVAVLHSIVIELGVPVERPTSFEELRSIVWTNCHVSASQTRVTLGPDGLARQCSHMTEAEWTLPEWLSRRESDALLSHPSAGEEGTDRCCIHSGSTTVVELSRRPERHSVHPEQNLSLAAT